MSTPRPGLPQFYATGLAKILVGEQPCRLEAWLKGHLNIEKRQSDFTAYKIRHTELLTAEVERLKAEGWKVTVERFLRIKGATAILTGKPDIIAQKPNWRPKVVDVKGGAPKESDVAQVQIYMVAVPMAWNAPGMIFDGQVVYASPTLPVLVKAASIPTFKPKLFSLLRELAVYPNRPDASPSESNCRFCDVTEADCPSRWNEADAEVLTSEW